MPEQSHPPYVSGGLSIPRQLQRWLDTNPQNGPLKRTETFFNLPSFNVGNVWNRYSDIVLAYNIESPNNISLKNYFIPTSPTYVMCVSYRVGGVVTRYMLWDAVGSNMNQIIPLYTGQKLLKNFRFEVWNTSQGASSQLTDMVFYTSKRGNIDYRYGTDSALANPDPTVVLFSDSTSHTGASSNLIRTDALYVNVGAPYGIYQAGPFIVGQNYTISFAGNAVSVSNGSDIHFPGDTFSALFDVYAVNGPNGLFNALVTNTITGPAPAFGSGAGIVITFPSNAVSITN